ncbi:MAG: hypothetical protein R3D25_08295 [Geminicoccaceae bacterium]
MVAGARVALERGRLAGDAAARSLGLGAALADDLARPAAASPGRPASSRRLDAL